MRRLHCGPARWHVFSRGARRLALFQDDADYQTFVDCLKFSLRISGLDLWAYALMSNHYHLTLEGDSDQLREGMQQANRLYSGYHNRKYALSGHAFDGPYQSFPLRTDGMVLWNLAYVFLNPVKAGRCPNPEDYAWSGYRSFLGMPGSPLAVGSCLLTRLELPVERSWELFHVYVQRQLRQPPKKVSGKPTMVEVHRSQFQWLLTTATESTTKLSLEDRQMLAAYWARQCGIAPRVMATVLDEQDPRQISRLLYRFKRRLEKDPSLAGLLSVPSGG